MVLTDHPLTPQYVLITCLNHHVLISPSKPGLTRESELLMICPAKGLSRHFQTYLKDFDLPGSHLFRYFQIRHFLQKQNFQITVLIQKLNPFSL